MQIKRGPFGYFATEKFDSPDRLCTYAEEVIAGNKSDFYLTPVTEQIGSGAMCYFEFSGFLPITDAEFSVFSPQSRSASHKKGSKILSLRRRSVGDLFYTFINLLDNLISPSCLVLDPEMVFSDPEGISIKLCCLPIKSKPEELCLSSLGAMRLEKLLSCDFFKNVLTDDEKNALVYSVKDNNEEMFLRIADTIRGNIEEPDPETASEDAPLFYEKFLPDSLKKLSKSEKDLILSCISALLSILSFIGSLYLTCFFLFALSLVILFGVLKKQKKQKENIRKELTKEKSRQRSSILFSDSSFQSENDLFDKQEENNKSEQNTSGNSDQANKKQYQPLTSGKLTLVSDYKGINHDYSVYLDETYIGSDCFLSDIVLDDPLVSPLHAVIKQKNGTFYLEPAKGTGKSYIEDSPVENGKTYEIKSGQKITIGNIAFRFAVEPALKASY